ncbi:BatA domain-containing protein [Calditrichota bacterium]
MTFLHTIFLSALAAAAIPLLLHLLSRRRLPLIKFSTLEFLQRLQKRKSRRVQLRQLILLAIRTLAVAAVVLVFARPAMQISEAGASAASVEMVVILDDGVSSHAETIDGNLWRMIGSRVTDLAELVNESDRLTILYGSDPNSIATFQTGEEMLVADYIENHTPTYEQLKINQALSIADSLFATSSRFNRELYIVGGFYEDIYDSLKLSLETESVKKLLLPVGPEQMNNLSIDSVHIENTILQENSAVELTAVIHNHGDKQVEDALVSAYLDNERVAQATVNIGAGSVATAVFRLTPRRAGEIGGWIKIEEIDPLEVDSRRYFMLDIPRQLKIFAVAEDTLSRLLLQAAIGREQTGHIQLDWQPRRSWEASSFSGYDMIFLAGVSNVSHGAAARIVDFVKSGNGLIFLPGMDSDLAALSRGLWKQLGFAGAEGLLESVNIRWGKYDLNHPIFNGIFESGGKPESPTINHSVKFLTRKGDHVIIPLSNGKPFLLERIVGEGRALMFSSPFLPAAGDFVFSGIVAPLLTRSINYACSPVENSLKKWTTGEQARILLSTRDNSPARLTAPDQSESQLTPHPVLNGVAYTIEKLELPGIYKLQTKSGLTALIPVNPPAGGSDLNRKDLKHIDDVIVVNTDTGEDFSIMIAGLRYGREIWQPLALIFLLLLVAESIIGRSGGKE